MNILILNGVNLNMLGRRESIYGNFAYYDLEEYIKRVALEFNVEIKMKQTNHEGEMVEWIQNADADYILINPGAWTHYSYAIRDALASVNIPFVEVHITNVKERESFRAISVIEDIAIHTVMGLGIDSYKEAVRFVVKR